VFRRADQRVIAAAERRAAVRHRHEIGGVVADRHDHELDADFPVGIVEPKTTGSSNPAPHRGGEPRLLGQPPVQEVELAGGQRGVVDDGHLGARSSPIKCSPVRPSLSGTA
jgi:hypothetical protein